MNASVSLTSVEAKTDMALKAHITDAAIAAQLKPPTDAEFLAKCARVRQARDQLRRQVSISG